jgi:hypothetical protein
LEEVVVPKDGSSEKKNHGEKNERSKNPKARRVPEVPVNETVTITRIQKGGNKIVTASTQHLQGNPELVRRE